MLISFFYVLSRILNTTNKLTKQYSANKQLKFKKSLLSQTCYVLDTRLLCCNHDGQLWLLIFYCVNFTCNSPTQSMLCRMSGEDPSPWVTDMQFIFLNHDFNLICINIIHWNTHREILMYGKFMVTPHIYYNIYKSILKGESRFMLKCLCVYCLVSVCEFM